jgi:hypothetical protein
MKHIISVFFTVLESKLDDEEFVESLMPVKVTALSSTLLPNFLTHIRTLLSLSLTIHLPSTKHSLLSATKIASSVLQKALKKDKKEAISAVLFLHVCSLLRMVRV